MQRDRSTRDPIGSAQGTVASVVRWGYYSIAVNLVLIVLHGLIATALANPGTHVPSWWSSQFL